MLLHNHWGQMVLARHCSLRDRHYYLRQSRHDERTRTCQGHSATLEDNKDYRFGLGIFVAIVSGVLSACFNFGIEAGKINGRYGQRTYGGPPIPGQGNFLFQNNVTYVVILWGGLTTNFIWCMILNARNKTFGDYTNKKQPLLKNYLFCAHWRELPGFCSSFFMAWAKANWAMAPVPGYCTWHLLSWWPICGDWY